MRRLTGIAALVLGVLLLVGSGVTHWVLTPRLAQLPGNQATTRVYAGVGATVANPTIATGTVYGPGLLRDVPLSVRHYTKVVATRGHNALVQDERTVMIPGFTIADLKARYSVDRRTFLPTAAFATATKAVGLTFNWPLGARPHDYTGWVSDTGRTTRLHYVARVQHAGITTYEFTTSTAPARIVDPAVLRIVPASLTKKQLMQITPSLGFTTAQLLKLNKVLTPLPDPVRLAYTYRVTSTLWVAPATGVVVDHQQREVRALELVTPTGTVPVAPVLDMSYHFTPASVTAAVQDAKNGAAQLTLVRTTLPLALLGGGALLTVIGLLLLLGRRRQPHGKVDDAALAQLLSSESHHVDVG